MNKILSKIQINRLTNFAVQHKAEMMFYIFCTIVSLLFTLHPRLIPLSFGLIDPSYNYAVNYATTQNLSFGTDFIATYGPMGWLVINYLPETLLLANVALLVYAFMAATGVFMFTQLYLVQKRDKIIAAVILIYLLNISSRAGFVEWSYLLLFLLYGFLYLGVRSPTRRYLLGLLVVFAGILTYTKFTLGVASIATLLLLIVFEPKLSLKTKIFNFASVLAGSALSLIVIGRMLHVENIMEYLRTSFIISTNFSSAMALSSPQTKPATILAFVTIVVFVFWVIIRDKVKSSSLIFVTPSLYVVWKYSTVRQDEHLLALLSVILPLVTMYFFLIKKRRMYDICLLMTVVILSILAVWANNIPFYGSNGFLSSVTAPMHRITSGGPARFFDINGQENNWAEQTKANLAPAILPDSMKARIGNGSVDIFPWETVLITANNLSWKNRPLPFSFNVFDPYLDNINSKFFEDNNRAPDYIVWHNTGVKSIDERNILWDEPLTILSIMRNYRLAEFNSNFMLLARREKPLDQRTELINASFSDAGVIKFPTVQDSIVTIKFKLDESLKTKLRTAILRDSVHSISINKEGKFDRQFRFVKENSEQGFIVNNLPTDWSGLVDLIGNKKSKQSGENILIIPGLDHNSVGVEQILFNEAN
jgi:hypothetical protein